MRLQRSAPLPRRIPLRRTGIRPRSKRKQAEIEIRRSDEFRRDRCELAGVRFPCWGPIDRHEIVRRSQDRHASITPEVVIGLCRAHHQLDTHLDDAVELGIRIHAWEWHRADAYERNRLIKDAARKRRASRKQAR